MYLGAIVLLMLVLPLLSVAAQASMLPDAAAKEKDTASRKATFTNAVQNMKILAEGGTLPPAPPRGAGPGN